MYSSGFAQISIEPEFGRNPDAVVKWGGYVAAPSTPWQSPKTQPNQGAGVLINGKLRLGCRALASCSKWGRWAHGLSQLPDSALAAAQSTRVSPHEILSTSFPPLAWLCFPGISQCGSLQATDRVESAYGNSS
jgi:hypothetical protein